MRAGIAHRRHGGCRRRRLVAALPLPPSPASPSASAMRLAGSQHVSTLDDQAELSVTVYNSDLALVRDVRNLRLPAGSSTCSSWTSPRPSIRRPCTSVRSPSRPRSACSNRTTNTTCSNRRSCCASTSAARSRWSARARTAARPAGGSPRAASQLQQRAGLADRQGDRHRPARRSHPLPGAAREPVQPADPDLVAAQQRRRAPSGRSVVPRQQAVVERRLRADGEPRRPSARISTAGSPSPTAAARRSTMRSCSWSPVT